MSAARRVVASLVAALTASVALGVCSGEEHAKAPKAFCLAAKRYEDELTREGKRGEKDVDRQLELVEKMLDVAPKAIRKDVSNFVDALRQVRDDPSLAKDKQFQARGEETVANVNRYASNGCGFFKRDPSSGI